MKKLILKIFLSLIALIILVVVVGNVVIFVLSRTDSGQRVALSLYKKIGTYRFKRLARKAFKSNDLHLAVLSENLEDVKELVLRYKDEDKAKFVNKKDELDAALQMAVWLGNKEIIEYLLENGADIESKGYLGRTILVNFILDPRPVYDMALFDFVTLSSPAFLTAGGPIDSFLKFLQLFVFNTLGAYFWDITREERVPWDYTFFRESRPWDMLQFLLDKGADINAPGKMTPLVCALISKDTRLIKFLLEHGANVTAAGTSRVPPLHLAHTLEIARLFLEKGADLHAVNKRGDTPLHSAVKRGRLDVARLLLENGADINAVNKKQLTPLALGNVEIVQFLLENYGKDIISKNITSTFGYACKKGKLDVVTYLLEKRKNDISQKDIPLLIEKVKKEKQKIVDDLNEGISGVPILRIGAKSIEEEIEDMTKEARELVTSYEKILRILNNLKKP